MVSADSPLDLLADRHVARFSRKEMDRAWVYGFLTGSVSVLAIFIAVAVLAR